jgi:branched-chain amino acid transport system substrate-binding protein
MGPAGSAQAAETIRIADIDAFSGAFANVGENFLAHNRTSIDAINARGGVLGGTRLEIVTFDGKANPQDSLLALQQAIDQGIRYVIQASGSAVAGASLEAIAKHNSRYPDRAVLYLNYGAMDPALTESRCNFWHFRFIEHTHMQMEALTRAIAPQTDLKKFCTSTRTTPQPGVSRRAGHARGSGRTSDRWR